jgi:P-type Cu+ transporter
MAAERQENVPMTLGLQGMTCAACANRIQNGLSKVPGVKAAVVNFATEKRSCAVRKAHSAEK